MKKQIFLNEYYLQKKFSSLPSSPVIVGKGHGKKLRKYFNLDELEINLKKNESIQIVSPEWAKSVITSFLDGLIGPTIRYFGPTIRYFGKERFLKMYSFKWSKLQNKELAENCLNEVINKNHAKNKLYPKNKKMYGREKFFIYTILERISKFSPNEILEINYNHKKPYLFGNLKLLTQIIFILNQQKFQKFQKLNIEHFFYDWKINENDELNSLEFLKLLKECPFITMLDDDNYKFTKNRWFKYTNIIKHSIVYVYDKIIIDIIIDDLLKDSNKIDDLNIIILNEKLQIFKN